VCLTKYHAMRMYWGSGGIAPRILHLGTRWRWVVSFTPRPLYPHGKRSWYTLDRRLGGPESRSGHGVEEKNSQGMLCECSIQESQKYISSYIKELTSSCLYMLAYLYFITPYIALNTDALCLKSDSLSCFGSEVVYMSAWSVKNIF